MDVDPKTLEQAAPGLFGAFGALFFLKGPWLIRLGMVIPGAAAAHYGGPDISRQFGMSIGIAAFATGLLSMLIVSKLIETWQSLELGTLISQWIRKILGLKANNE